MRKRQTGEVMMAMMVVMLIIVLLSKGHMGMTGHDHVANQNGAEQKAQTAPVPSATPAKPDGRSPDAVTNK